MRNTTGNGSGSAGSAAADAGWEAAAGWDKLRRYSYGKWGFLWRVPGTNEQIVCDYWRHRREIGYVYELTEGPHRDLLLAKALADYRQQQAALVLATPIESQCEVRGWDGFQVVEEVVQYQRVLTEEPLSDIRALHFRRYTLGDRDAVVMLEREAFPWIWWSGAEELRWYDGLMGTQFWVVRQHPDGEVIGLLGMTLSLGVGHVDRLAILPRYQGRGYGEATLAFGLSQLWKRGVRRVSLLTQADNHRSQSLYSKAGFRATSWRQRFYGLWLDPVLKAVAGHIRAL
ncbi:MAG: GNAT family N-acetyltransferase [Bacteroidetes bacterium]|nr:GNAT family N-acetyltransferase [Bacteroidota bacterium]MCL5025436.1 GNAT family N-acetyltransferase [Chloroflexota bacterium]